VTERTDLVGKTVLVGLVFFDEKGGFLKQEQRHGQITSVGPQALALQLSSGEPLVLPPDTEVLQVAPVGSFRENSSGDSVENPDFIANWILTRQTANPETWNWRPGPKIAFPEAAPDA
jgi:hypothetical protein